MVVCCLLSSADASDGIPVRLVASVQFDQVSVESAPEDCFGFLVCCRDGRLGEVTLQGSLLARKQTEGL